MSKTISARINSALFYAVWLAMILVCFLFLNRASAAEEVVTSTEIVFEWGKYVEQFADILLAVILPLVLMAFTYVLSILPKPIADILSTARVEQLLEKAVQYGINSVKGAVKDEKLSVEIGSAVVAEAVNYALAQGPAKLIEWVGGKDALVRMIVARLEFEKNADKYDLPSDVPEA